MACFLAIYGGSSARAELANWSLPRLAGAPIIDGVLDDAAWTTVPVIENFRQVEPQTGGPPTEMTRVQLGLTDAGIYFAIVATDRKPSGIVATQRKRDASLAGDDHFSIVLETFLDRRNGYVFIFNPLGARQDALIRGGVTLNEDWDGLWEVAATRTETGWQAEVFIPLTTLSFRSNAPTWGLNLERYIARSGERIRWHGTERQYEVTNLGNTGNLSGLEALKRPAGIEVRPFVTVSTSRDRRSGQTDTDLKPGFDVFYKLTEATTAVLTINTDFADAEVDDRVVNLTRFPIRFPEKRAFFLQDAGVFSYSLINNNPLPYYSRRIGLGPRGEVVDLNGGLRISGREGAVNFGLLGVSTRASGDLEAKELAVGRVLFNLSDEASIGAIGTWGDPRTNGDAWHVGADLNYTTGRLFGRSAHLLRGSLYYQHTQSDEHEGDSNAFGWGLIYDSPTWGFTSYLDRVGESYYPALGRVNQTGVYYVTGKLDYEFNPEPFKAVVPIFNYVRRHNMIYQDREQVTYGPELLIETVRGDSLLLRVRREHERLDVADIFNTGPGIEVQPGNFEGDRFQADLTLSKSRPLSLELGVARIPFYGGHQLAYTSAVTWRPSAIFNLDASFDYTRVRLPYADFPVRLFSIGGAVQFSSNLIWSTLAQWDNISGSVGFNSRVRWTYATGGDLFVIINQGADVIDGRWEFTRTEVSAKLGATWRF